MQVSKQPDVKDNDPGMCPSCKVFLVLSASVLLNFGIVCRKCGYIFCSLCYESYCYGHFKEKHNLNKLNKLPLIIKPVTKKPITMHKDVFCNSEEWYCVSMRVAALLNTSMRMTGEYGSKMHLQNDFLLKHLSSIMGTDKKWMITVISCNKKISMKSFIWKLCKTLILNYCFLIREYKFTDEEKEIFFASHEEKLDLCESIINLERQKDKLLSDSVTFTVTDISIVLNSILNELITIY